MNDYQAEDWRTRTPTPSEHDDVENPSELQHREQALPLSAAQQGLLYLALVGEDGSAYNLSWAGRVCGPLDVSLLAKAFNELGAVHEQLARRIGLQDGQFVSFAATDPLMAQHIQRPGISAIERDADAQQMTDDDAHRDFDLIGGELTRLTTVTYANDDHLVLLTVHHVVADGWSLEVIYRDLSRLYARIQRTGASHRESQGPVSGYGQYLESRESLSPERRARHLTSWKTELSGASFEINVLEAGDPAPRISETTSARESIVLSEIGAGGVQSLAATTYSTPFMVTLAIFARALGLAVGRDQVVIGSPFGARPSMEFDNVVGMFVNTLPLTIRGCTDGPLAETVSSAREATLFALEHQETPLQEIVGSLSRHRDPTNDSLFGAGFTYVPWGTYVEMLHFPNTDVSRLLPNGQAPKFPLLFTVAEQEDSTLMLTLEYSVEIVGRSNALALLKSFAAIAESARETASEPNGLRKPAP